MAASWQSKPKSYVDFYGNPIQIDTPTTLLLEKRSQKDQMETPTWIGTEFKRENMTAQEMMKHINSLVEAAGIFTAGNPDFMRYDLEVKIKERRKNHE